MTRITIKKLTRGTNAGRYAVRDDGVTRVSFASKRSAEKWANARRKIFKNK